MSISARKWIAHLAAAAAAVAGFVLVRFPPTNTSFYPRCPVFFWLHLYCPGCGGTRALAALLHGRLQEALHWNAMVVVSLPFAAAFFAMAYRRAIRAEAFCWPRIPDGLLTCYLVVAGIFTVARNLPAH
jgi:uncharacterized membrane protein (Fun14 family)